MPRSFVFVLSLLTVSLGFNVSLAWKMKQMQTPGSPPNKVGVQMSSFTAADLEGHAKDISFDTGKPTLIYYIDPECRWCKSNTASFDALARAIDNKVTVVVLSRRAEKVKEFLGANRLNVPVLILNSPKVIKNLDLTATPQTFAIDAKGRVENHWYGAYIGETRADIERTFRVRLPET